MKNPEPEVDDVLMPWEGLFPKQLEVFNAGNAEYSAKHHPNFPSVVLTEGPRWSSKTVSVCHRVIRHLWETPGARAAMVAKTIPSAKDAGSWLDLIDIAMPQWINAGIADEKHGGVFRFTTFDREGVPGPIQSAKSRTMFFRIENAYGGESEMILMSLQHDHEVKQKLKNTRFSLLWFPELTNFLDQKVLSVSLESLRMYHLKRWQHMWIGDTNPSEEGMDSWIYKKWIERSVEEEESAELRSSEFQKAMVHIHFDLKDNLSLTNAECEARREMYADDPGELDREFYGKWTKGHGTRGLHFADVFSRSRHVIGAEGTGEIQIDKATDTLLTGWDIGKATNQACGMIEKRYVFTPDKKQMWSVFSILDSISRIDEQSSVAILGTDMLEKMQELDREYSRKFMWIHYADDSAMNVWNATSEAFDYEVIQNATNGEINLTGVPKPSNSIEARVRLIRQLLREGRLYVAGRCLDVIQMFEDLKRGGNTRKDYVHWDKNKHVFDWISYVLYMQCFEELDRFRPSASKGFHVQVQL